jgi:hypothetical protein
MHLNCHQIDFIQPQMFEFSYSMFLPSLTHFVSIINLKFSSPIQKTPACIIISIASSAICNKKSFNKRALVVKKNLEIIKIGIKGIFYLQPPFSEGKERCA